jgi:hypothetical protein
MGKALRQRISPACPVSGETRSARLARLAHHHHFLAAGMVVLDLRIGSSLFVRVANYMQVIFFCQEHEADRIRPEEA